MNDGPSLWNSEGCSEGCFVGILVGSVDENKVAPLLGNGEGESDDEIDGLSLRDKEGYSEGLLDWYLESNVDGMNDGPSLSNNDGNSDEIFIEFLVGDVEIDGRSLGGSDGY